MSGQGDEPNAQGLEGLKFTNYAPVADGSIASKQFYEMSRNFAASPGPPTQQIIFKSLVTPTMIVPIAKSRHLDRFRHCAKYAISSMETAPVQPSGARKRKADALNDSNSGTATKKSKMLELNGLNQVEQISCSTQTVDTSEVNVDDTSSEISRPTSTVTSSRETTLIPEGLSQTKPHPIKPYRRMKERCQATILRKDRPVTTEIPLDVWRRVLEFCPLAFLVKARTINRNFHLALTYETTWRRARKRAYGYDCPDPPAGLTEFQFADLVNGSGCQSKECSGRGKCRKIYWACQRRWCESCLNKRIVMENSMSAITNEYPNLSQCLYFATFDRWDNYQCTGRYDHTPTWIRNQGMKRGFERRAVTNAIQEIDEISRKDPCGTSLKSSEEVDQWFTRKTMIRDELVGELQTIETWWEEVRLQRVVELEEIRANRIAFFEESAKKMVPPLSSAAIHKTVSFQRAIKIGTAESNDRSWKILEKKLQVERIVAERLVKEEEEDSLLTPDEPGNLWQPIDGFSRVTIENPDCVGLLAVADRTIQRLSIQDGSSGIADEDIIPLVLKEIRKDYYRVDDSQTLEVERSVLRLVLEDAKEVYERKLEPIISGWEDKGREKAATLLKCPFCTKKNGNTRWTFPHLMLHVGEEHAMCSTQLTAWQPRKKVFPWHRIEWPKNLPIITGRQNIPGKWDVSSDAEYCYETSVTTAPSVVASYKDAFENRSVAHELGFIDHNTFVENVIYAAGRFRNTSLASKYVAQLVLQFALQKYYRAMDNIAPAFSFVAPLQLALLRDDHHTLFDGFKCKWCCEQPEPSKNSRFINKGQPFGELMDHFGLYYHPRHQWSTRALNFASGEELDTVLREPGQEQAFKIFTDLFPIADHDDAVRMLN